ncbi:MAG TPA: alpha/beta hydrolase-fold protein [Polyangium sp.]|nr:alpha/beta hydrolase-fold protein [Polyangium sp.]
MSNLRRSSSLVLLGTTLLFPACTVPPPPAQTGKVQQNQPAREDIVIGESFTVDSKVLAEKRRLTVYLPQNYDQEPTRRYPVLYLLDGGIKEDFHHITGIVQVSVSNGLMDPILVIGIENIDRRHDVTPPTENPEDKKSAPRAGGSQKFRAFLKDEVFPLVERDFRGNGERTLIGESLAGLFVMETFLEDPSLFQRYISVSPSLWWNDEFLLKHAAERLKTLPLQGRTLYLTVGDLRDNKAVTDKLADMLRQTAPPGLTWYYEPLPDEEHATMLHAGALRALRKFFPAKK